MAHHATVSREDLSQTLPYSRYTLCHNHTGKRYWVPSEEVSKWFPSRRDVLFCTRGHEPYPFETFSQAQEAAEDFVDVCQAVTERPYAFQASTCYDTETLYYYNKPLVDWVQVDKMLPLRFRGL